MTLKYIEAKNHYEAFAQAFYAETYHRAGQSLIPNPPKRRRDAGKTGNDGGGDAMVQVWSQ